LQRSARLIAVALLAATGVPVAAVGAEPSATQSPPVGRPASPGAIAEYVRARLAEITGDAPAALEALRRALAHDPESAQLRISYAQALARAGRLEAGEGEARRAVSQARGLAARADANLVLARILVLRQRGDAAERQLHRAVRLEAERVRTAPKDEDEARRIDPEAWRLLARLQAGRGDVAAALVSCEDLAALDRAVGAATLRDLGEALVEGGDVPGAERFLARAVELAPADGEAWKLLGRVLEAQDRVPDARAAVERALVADPADGAALAAAGRLALRQDDLAAARAWFGQLLHTAQDEAAASLRVTAAWLDAGRPAEALEASGSADLPELVFLRGVALMRLRRFADAIATLDALTPAHGAVYPLARAARARALARTGKAQEALRSLEEALDRDGRDPVLLYALGEAHDRAGDRDRALTQMRAVLEVKPDHPEALNYLGYAYAERGERLDEAERMIREALRQEPANAAFLDSLGWVLFKKGDLAGAVELLEQAVARAGADPAVLDHLGDAYRSAQRHDDARGAYRRALEAGSERLEEDPSIDPVAFRASLQRKLAELGPVAAGPGTR
jgi:tetratricopeptide (TPR) repeat protein